MADLALRFEMQAVEVEELASPAGISKEIHCPQRTVKTKVLAKKNVTAQFLQDGSVTAGGDVNLGNFAYHARIQSGGQLEVSRGRGGRGGSVMGGASWSRGGMSVHCAGTPSGTAIKATTGPRRKILATRAEQLGKLAQVYQKLAGGRKELESEITTEAQKAEISVGDTAFPGVTVRIGQYQRKLDEAVKAPRFRIVEGRLVDW